LIDDHLCQWADGLNAKGTGFRMTFVLQIGDRTIRAEEVLSMMAGYQMLPQFVRELLIDQAIAAIECTPEETVTARQQFFAQNQINSEADLQAWLSRYGMAPSQAEALTTREMRIQKFQQATWEPKLESYFLSRKTQLDKVIYSLVRTRDVGIAQEIYFRVLEGEQSFAELARVYSQGPEAQTDGLIGPVELSVPHPTLAQILSLSQPGQLSPPTRVGEWLVLVRLEKFIPAQLDEPMRRRLLDECFNNWLQQQLAQLMPTFSSSQAALPNLDSDSLDSPGLDLPGSDHPPNLEDSSDSSTVAPTAP
jgi:parvulin-like peptidyl-prolyl isomerase